MYTIRKSFEFSASHQLKGLSGDHPCGFLHGHNYQVTIELKSKKLNNVGFILDYRELSFVKDWLDQNWDHKHLNDRIMCNPTAENMAKHLFETFETVLPELFAVEVSETNKTSARYEAD
jgi:6-pyruvoyltetrahydropterin/6-carboxytetrahydropterin synthase